MQTILATNEVFDENLREITDNMDEYIGVPIGKGTFADPMRYGRKLYKLLMEKFVNK